MKFILVMLGSLLMVVIIRLDFNIEFVVKIVIGGLMELEQIETSEKRINKQLNYYRSTPLNLHQYNIMWMCM